MEKMVKKVLVSEKEVEEKIKELAGQITEDYQGENLLLVGILKGAVIFMSELAKNIKLPVEIDFMAVSSYGKSSKSTGEVRIIKDLDHSVEGKNLLVIEDIIDTGYTLSYLMDNLRKRGAKSVKVCSLLDKPDRRKADIHVDYLGFEVPDEFIVGYGLDYAEQYRNLPYVAALKEEAYK